MVWVLESKKLLSKFQCGFRKDHSTLDHLVRFEHFIREAFARKKQVLAVFFDLEKAYDTTWKHGILTDLFDLEFRGRLPIFIQNFLSDRHFQVKSGSTFSNPYLQENGVPQGSILSPMLFNLKINNIMKSVSNNANASLFVDDFAVYIEGKHLKHLERSMQLCINKIQKWVAENGFKFSISKTTCVHFHKQRIYTEPTLHLDGQAIPVKDEVKFLGLVFDKKLDFKVWVRGTVRTGAGRAANGLRGPPKGGSQAKIIKLVKMDTENLVQWNIRGLKSNYEELKLLLNKTYTPIVALQDCKLGEEQLSPRGYALLKGNCPAGEAALLINQRVVHTELTLNSTLHAVAATVTLNKTFTICSIYLTPGESITKLNLENLIDQLPRPFLLLGDFNAHSPVWGDSRRDGRRKLIESFLQDNDLILLNSKSPTFVHSAYNSTSAIDLSVASPTIALDFQWSVHDDLCGSDHFPIFLTTHAEDNTTHSRYNFKKANWNLFGDLCSRSIDQKILESDCPVELFTEKITAAAREAIPPYRGGKNLPRVPWFNEECKQAILDRKRAQRKYFKHPTLLNFINFKKAKAKSKFIIKQSKASSWRHYVSTINSHTSTKSVWKKMRKIKGKDTTPKTHLKKNTI